MAHAVEPVNLTSGLQGQVRCTDQAAFHLTFHYKSQIGYSLALIRAKLLVRGRERVFEIYFVSMASKLVLIVVFIFDLIAFGLAVAAEQRRSTGKVVLDNEQKYKYCVYDSDVATGYGVGALVLLLASQVLVMAASRCFCCGRSLRPGGSRACAVVLFLLCWLTFIIAEACLLAGSVRNAYHYRYTTLFVNDPPSCQTVRKGVFAAGAAFVFFTAILSEFYYTSYSKARNTGIPPYGYGKEPAVGMSPYT